MCFWGFFFIQPEAFRLARLESELHRLSLFPRTTPLKAGDEEAEAQVSPWAAADAPGRG